MTAPLPDRLEPIRAPATWKAVDFISDVHLHSGDPATAQAWLSYLQRPPQADALFILGDLFELWIGDDELDDALGFSSACAGALRRHSDSTPTYFLCGNRDFLLGQAALSACGMQGLSDPTVLEFGGRRWLLSHGDALCLEDTEYQAFREQVRSPQWQQTFLSRPLAERAAQARDMRAHSEARKRDMAHDPELWADVDADAARAWLSATGADTMIHGHTHRPAAHDLGLGLTRVVLSDWDATATPPRLELLRLTNAGLSRLPLA
jgi:UDP-2,3-diacylglucosamine hydrolase